MAEPPNRVSSTVDIGRDMCTRPSAPRQDGFKGHVAVEPGTGLFGAVALAKAAGEASHEAIVAPSLLAENPSGTAVLGDSADGTGDPAAALAYTGHDAVIKPPILTKDDDWTSWSRPWWPGRRSIMWLNSVWSWA